MPAIVTCKQRKHAVPLNQNIRFIAAGVECGHLERRSSTPTRARQAMISPIPVRANEGPSISYFSVASSAKLRTIAE